MRRTQAWRTIPSGKASGFTTLEVLIVVVLALVVAGVATPSLINNIQRYRLRGGADRVMTDLRELQSLAMTTGARHRLTVSDCTTGPSPCKRYRMEKQVAGAWPASTAGSGGPVLSEWVDLQGLYTGVRISAVQDNSSGSSVDSVVYDPRGISVTSASPYSPMNVTVTITHTSGQVRRVLVRTAGSVRMQ